MTQRGLVKLGRHPVTGETIPDGELRYERGALKFAPWLESVPLLVDHAAGARIGTVRELFTMRDLDGDWLAANVEFYPDAPAWIAKGSPASLRHELLRESTFRDGVVLGGLIQEVSILRELTPAQPGAKVWRLYERAPLTEANWQAVYFARIEQGEDPETVIADLQRQLARGRRLPRPPRGLVRVTGRVLGVR